MDEILPLVENAEGDETLAQDDDYNHASNNSSVEHDLEQPENNSDEIRNDGNLEHNVDRNNTIEEGNIFEDPNLEDQRLLIYLEGAPDYRFAQPIQNDEDMNRESDENINDVVNNDGNALLIDHGPQEEPLRQMRGRRIQHMDDIRENDNNLESDSDDESYAADEREEESELTVTSSSDGEGSQEDEDHEGERESFDTELPAQHRYMGESREVGGRIILEEELYVDIPVISQPGIILMPGQTLPMTFFQPAVISMMKRLVETTKTFGVLHKR